MIRSIKVPEQEQDELNISNEQIRQVAERCSVKLPPVKQMVRQKNERKRNARASEHYLMEVGKRKWMSKHGRKFLINFDEAQRKEMKHYFNALDQKNHGSIGIEQLEELLVSVGLAESREEVKRLIDLVDEDHSGKIEFDEFLEMIQSEGEGEGDGRDLIKFFKTIISGKLDPSLPQGLSFQLMVSNFRRKKMMAALNMHPNAPPGQTEKGLRIIEAYRQMNEKRLIRKIRQEERKKL